MLPARGDAHRLREPGRIRKPPGFEPLPERAGPGAERLLLQRIERCGPAAVPAEHFARFVQRLLRVLDGVAQRPHRFLRAGLLRLGRFQLSLHPLQPFAGRRRIALQRIGIDRAAFGFEGLCADLEITDARFEMPDTDPLRVHRLGRSALALTQRLDLPLQRVHVFLDRTELALRTRRLRAQRLVGRLVERKLCGELLAPLALGLDLDLRRFEAFRLLALRGGELRPTPADRLNGFLGARDLRARLQHVPVAAVVRLHRLGMGGARLLERRLHPALAGQSRVEPLLLVPDPPGVAARFLVEGTPLERQMLGFELALRRLELAELPGQGRLALQVGQPARELLAQIVQSIEVLERMAHPVLGLAPTLLVPGDPRRLLEEVAQILRLGLDDPRDHPLLDDRVAAGAEPGAVKYVHHVAPPAPRSVQPVRGLSFAHELAAHRDLVVRGEAAADPAVQVVEDQLDARAAHRLARPRSVEHDVRHGVAAQAARRDLAHHPADRVDDVGLAAAVRPDDPDDVAGELDGGGIDEGLEAREPNLS